MCIVPFICFFVSICIFFKNKRFSIYNFSKFLILHSHRAQFCNIKSTLLVVWIWKPMRRIIKTALQAKFFSDLVHFLNKIQYLCIVSKLTVLRHIIAFTNAWKLFSQNWFYIYRFVFVIYILTLFIFILKCCLADCLPNRTIPIFFVILIALTAALSVCFLVLQVYTKVFLTVRNFTFWCQLLLFFFISRKVFFASSFCAYLAGKHFFLKFLSEIIILQLLLKLNFHFFLFFLIIFLNELSKILRKLMSRIITTREEKSVQ